jgi:hypothetical protein
MIVDRIDLALVGPREIARKLQIVGRVGEDEIDARAWDFFQFGQAVADQNPIVQRPDVRPCLIPHTTPLYAKRN